MTMFATFDVTLFSLRSDAERFAFGAENAGAKARRRGVSVSSRESREPRGVSGSLGLPAASRYRNSANVNVERPFAVARVSRLASRVSRLASREKTPSTGFAEESENWLEIGAPTRVPQTTPQTLYSPAPPFFLPSPFLSRRLWKNQRQEGDKNGKRERETRRRKMLVCAFTARGNFKCQRRTRSVLFNGN